MNVRIEGERAENRNTVFHKKIVTVTPVPNTKSGNDVVLACGHKVRTFGDLKHANGVILCQECRAMGRKS